MISIQQMQYILVLSEEQHFQRASELCFVTQPTLSMQIKKAEETLGAALFDRSRNPVELTRFGKELLPVIRNTLGEYDKFSEVVQRSKGIYKEQIRMAIIPTISGYMLPDLYDSWKQELGHVQLTIEELKTEEIFLALEQKKIDIGILSGPATDPKFRVIPMFREEIKAYFPDENKQSISTMELINVHPWLLTSGNCLRTQMVHFCELNSDETKEDWDYEGGNIDILKRMVELHGGYTLIPANYIEDMNDDYKTITSQTGEIPAREIVAITSNRSAKWKDLEKLIRNIQLFYGKSKNEDNFQLLSWK